MSLEKFSRFRRKRVVGGLGLLTAVFAVGVLLHQAHGTRHRDDGQETERLVRDVVAVAGPGIDTTFSYAAAEKAHVITQSGPTRYYLACAYGVFSVGGAQYRCDGRVHVVGPTGRAGDRVSILTPASPWAVIARDINSKPLPSSLLPSPVHQR